MIERSKNPRGRRSKTTSPLPLILFLALFLLAAAPSSLAQVQPGGATPAGEREEASRVPS